MDMQTGDYIGGPLAAVYQAQSESANIGAKNLENIVKGMGLPKEQLEMQKYQALLDDPNYVKANTQFQVAATQAKLGDEEKKVAVNGLDRLLIQLQAYQGDPAKQREVIMQSFVEKGVDPTSPMGQAILADPYGKTMEARDKLVSTFAKTPQHMGEMEKQELVGKQHLDQIAAQILGQKEVARINASARFAKTPQEKEFAVVMGLMQVARDPNRSPEERAKAQQLVQDYTTYKQSTSSGFAGSTIGEGGIIPKSATAPQYNWGDQGGGGTYNYVPGQPLQPVGGGAAPAQRNPPVVGRSSAIVQDTGAPYIKQGGGGVVVGGNVYSMDEYKKLPISKQYEYADLPVK